MLELVAERVAVVGVFASSGALDALGGRPDVHRVAPDEAMVVGGPDAPPAVEVDDPDALVLDTTDGWSAWALTGDDARAAFTRLSALELPADGYVQGEVLGVPVRVIADPGRLLLLVPAMWGEHVRSRILDRCAGLSVREAP